MADPKDKKEEVKKNPKVEPKPKKGQELNEKDLEKADGGRFLVFSI